MLIRSFTSAFILYLLLMLIYLNPLKASEPFAVSAGTSAVLYTSYLARIECKNAPSLFDRCYRIFTTSSLVVTIAGVLAKQIDDVKPLAFSQLHLLETKESEFDGEEWGQNLDPRLEAVMVQVEEYLESRKLKFLNRQELLMWMVNG